LHALFNERKRNAKENRWDTTQIGQIVVVVVTSKSYKGDPHWQRVIIGSGKWNALRRKEGLVNSEANRARNTTTHTQEIEVEESIHVGIDKVLEEMDSNEK